MNQDQILISLILIATMGMFLWGRWRHDIVAIGALLISVVVGVLPANQAFLGFAHPAVITVACILILSRGLQASGAVDVLAHRFLPKSSNTASSLFALIGLGALLSSFMNNVGAMALLMPIAIKLAQRLKLPPGQVLMPLAFGTILGGMTTLIGTPPNLIVSGFRAKHTTLSGFGIFDFTPVGLAVAATGLIFIVLIGWRLVPKRVQSGIEGFESGAYLTEMQVPVSSDLINKSVRNIEKQLEEAGAQILAIIRRHVQMYAPNPNMRIKAGDILVVEIEADAIANILATTGLILAEAQPTNPPEQNEAKDASTNTPTTEDADKKTSHHDQEVTLVELVVLPNSQLAGTTAITRLFRTNYGINLLAISRQGRRSTMRLNSMPIKPGDLLLLQGAEDAISAFAADNSCVPLAERELRIPNKRKAWRAGLIMLATLGLALSSWVPTEIAFAVGVLAAILSGVVPVAEMHKSIDWSVIFLLAMLIPIAEALSNTGAADLIAQSLFTSLAQDNAIAGLLLILVLTMFLSDLMNNAATAAMMCPIAMSAAAGFHANPDTFLMAVAIGSSCAFLTPVGHQNNTLILGPSGFKFGDYWRLGLPLEILVVAVTMPVLLWAWPL